MEGSAEARGLGVIGGVRNVGVGLCLLARGAALLALLAASAASAERPSEPRWWERSHLTGDWGGRRETLAERGIVPGARYTAGFWSNVRGGFQTGTRYEGFAQWWLEADLDELVGWKSGSFDINWYSYHATGGPGLALWYVDFGLKLTRPFRGRDRDAFSLGFAHLRLSDDYVDSERARGENVSRRESVLELTYRLEMTGWLTLQPDVQFFFDPHFSRRDATVIGLRAVIEL